MTDAPAEVVEAQPEEEQPASVQVVPAPPPSRAEVLHPLDVSEVKGAMEQYQAGLRDLLAAEDWQGPPNQDGSFVKKSGWRKIATWFSLSVNLLPGTATKERDEDGQLLRASVWARAIAPNGRSADGDGSCAIDEPRFADEKGRIKVEHDLPATAATRAMNRAISNLVGMGAVSAEEVDAGQGARKGFASAKQETFLRNLLKKAGGSQDSIDTICAYASAELDGGRSGQISAAINGLKDDSKAKDVGKQLVTEAVAWQRKQSDVPADTEGLPDA